MADMKWKLLQSKPLFESKFLSILENDYELPDGTKAEGYYHLTRPDYVLILALDTQENICIERVYRRGVDDFVYEIPAGWIEKGETPKQAAERELKEETGYTGEVEILGEIYPQPGFCSMICYVAFARIDFALKGEQDLAPDETITYEIIALEKVREMIARGEVKDMGFLASLQMAESRLIGDK